MIRALALFKKQQQWIPFKIPHRAPFLNMEACSLASTASSSEHNNKVLLTYLLPWSRVRGYFWRAAQTVVMICASLISACLQ